jgi:hypothetical protein
VFLGKLYFHTNFCYFRTIDWCENNIRLLLLLYKIEKRKREVIFSFKPPTCLVNANMLLLSFGEVGLDKLGSVWSKCNALPRSSLNIIFYRLES